ncbi:MAG TPA: phosphate signaling complex protein PhoU [Gammaproteobacteria bacterium]|nr:phosphate signaling complex protein PhoU [Gammaproteobacteria bacterium]
MTDLHIGEHISRQYNEELEDIRTRVLAMGGLVEQQLKDAVQSLVEHDTELAAQVVQKDHEVNAMEVAIDEECTTILARRQPAASDLRLIVAVIKTITDLERIGDEAERIARMASRLSEDGRSVKLVTRIGEMGRHVREMVRGALDAFAHLDTDKAVEIWNRDRRVDEEYESLMRELMTFMMEDPRTIPSILETVFSIRALERIGDRATNICEYVIYLVKGKDVRHTRLADVDQQD